jgi:hypothetical protein
MNELQRLVEMLDASKTEHILPNDNTSEYNEGYVEGMNVAMNRIKELSLFNVVGQSEQFKPFKEAKGMCKKCLRHWCICNKKED